MARSEIRVIIDRPLSVVFATYTQPDTWQWTSMRSVRWTLGKPWAVASRLRIEIGDAYGTVVDQVLTEFEPNRFVSFISHFGGVTMQSQVHFRALSDTQTEVVTQLEFIGTYSQIAAFALRSSIERGAQQVYEDLKRKCEQPVAREQRRSTRVPLNVEIEARGIEEAVTYHGETVIVSCHGALILTVGPLRPRMRLEVRVIPTKRRALANVIYVDPKQPRLCGIGLLAPQNIWGLSSPPNDWPEGDSKSA